MINEEIIPIIIFDIRYFDLDISCGKNENACKCTEKPENPRAKAVRISESFFEKKIFFEIIKVAFPTSKNDAINADKVRFLSIADNRPIIPEKKIMYELIVIEEKPACLTDAVKLKLCLEISLIMCE